MKIFTTRAWYAEGLAFECVRCGRCCAGPQEGYVWITGAEIEKLAEFLHLSVEEIHQRYLRRVGRRVSLVESPESKDCIFLRWDPEGNSKCAIYAVRPTQCWTWPFWPTNLFSQETWNLAALRCPGINRERRHDLDEIEDKRRRTKA